MNKTEKGGGGGGRARSIEKANYMKMPCTLRKVKLQARAVACVSPLQDYR